MSEHSETLKVLSEILDALNLIASRLDTAEDAQDDEPLGPEPRLGALSERYESNGDPAAIGWDKVGGFSYGLYQIAARPGTMTKFLNFLESFLQRFEYPQFHRLLVKAGGNAGALGGTNQFKEAWRRLATNNPEFSDAQYEFIKATHYDLCIAKIREQTGIDVRSRSNALKNVAWSVATQHGRSGGAVVFKNAMAGLASSDDREVINVVYRERSKVGKYFKSSTAKVQASVKERFRKERKEALAMLAAEEGRAIA